MTHSVRPIIHIKPTSYIARLSLAIAVRIVLINLAEQAGETEHETALLVLSPGDLIFRGALRRQVVGFNKTCNVGAPISRWNSH